MNVKWSVRKEKDWVTEYYRGCSTQLRELHITSDLEQLLCLYLSLDERKLFNKCIHVVCLSYSSANVYLWEHNVILEKRL